MVILDIPMPKDCRECPLRIDYDCPIHERVEGEHYATDTEEYAHCPLREVQE